MSAVAQFIGIRAIIRCRDAGIHYGTVEAIDGRMVVLRDSRRIWRWMGALTLSHLATEGAPLDAEWSRIAPSVDSIVLLDGAEVLPLTEQAAARLDAMPDWRS